MQANELDHSALLTDTRREKVVRRTNRPPADVDLSRQVAADLELPGRAEDVRARHGARLGHADWLFKESADVAGHVYLAAFEEMRHGHENLRDAPVRRFAHGAEVLLQRRADGRQLVGRNRHARLLRRHDLRQRRDLEARIGLQESDELMQAPQATFQIASVLLSLHSPFLVHHQGLCGCSRQTPFSSVRHMLSAS